LLFLRLAGKAALISIWLTMPAVSQTLCGMSPQDWCPAPVNDPCGKHKSVSACRSDPACFGLPYKGESIIACQMDKRGFSNNCPTVGCTSTSPGKGAH